MTFASDGQLQYFLLSAAFGAALGMVKGLLPFRGKSEFIFDFCFFAAAGLAFVLFSYVRRFPDFRFYLAAGVFAGFWLSRKMLLFFVAKPLEKWYNHKKQRKTRGKPLV